MTAEPLAPTLVCPATPLGTDHVSVMSILECPPGHRVMRALRSGLDPHSAVSVDKKESSLQLCGWEPASSESRHMEPSEVRLHAEMAVLVHDVPAASEASRPPLGRSLSHPTWT
jgi:hypothetical protein